MNHERMLSRMLKLAAATLAMALMAVPVHAYEVSGMGGKLGYASPENLDGTASLGVHAELEKPNTHVHLLPNLMYWKVDRVRDVAPNMDVYYHFNPEGRVTPYLGGGLGVNFVHNSRVDRGSTDLGVNVMGGVRFPAATNHYFLEGRYTASDINQVSVLTGITFHTP